MITMFLLDVSRIRFLITHLKTLHLCFACQKKSLSVSNLERGAENFTMTLLSSSFVCHKLMYIPGKGVVVCCCAEFFNSYSYLFSLSFYLYDASYYYQLLLILEEEGVQYMFICRITVYLKKNSVSQTNSNETKKTIFQTKKNSQCQKAYMTGSRENPRRS